MDIAAAVDDCCRCCCEAMTWRSALPPPAVNCEGAPRRATMLFKPTLWVDGLNAMVPGHDMATAKAVAAAVLRFVPVMMLDGMSFSCCAAEDADKVEVRGEPNQPLVRTPPVLEGRRLLPIEGRPHKTGIRARYPSTPVERE